MRERFLIVDRAGNKIPDANAHNGWATQAGALSVSRRHQPCWIVREQHDGEGWKHAADVGFRDEKGEIHLN